MKKWGSFALAMVLTPIAWFLLYGTDMSACSGLTGMAIGLFFGFIALLAISIWLFRISFRAMTAGESGKNRGAKIVSVVWALIVIAGLIGMRINFANEALDDAAREIRFQHTRHFDSYLEIGLHDSAVERIERDISVASWWVSSDEKQKVREDLKTLRNRIARAKEKLRKEGR